jgi:DNA-binding MarR family transcriptional regulator
MNVRHAMLRDRTIPFAYRISFLANFFTGSVYGQVKARHGVVRSEFVVVYCLRLAGELSAQQICEITGRPKNSVSRAVNAMLDRGYIARDPDPTDARRGLLKLTRRGRELFDAAIPLFREREAAMLAPLTARESETLDRLLAKLVLRDDAWAEAGADDEG